MFFWIRIFWIILRNFKAKKQSSLAPNRASMRVWPLESEVTYANQAAYSHYLELARWNWAMCSGVVSQMRKQKMLFSVGGQIQYFKKPLKRFQKFEVVSQIIGWDDRWIYFEQSITSSGQLAFRAYVKLICRQGSKVVAPRDFLATLGMDGLPELTIPKSVRQWIDLERQMVPSPIKVTPKKQ